MAKSETAKLPRAFRPATVVISRHVAPGAETAYRDWAFRILHAAEVYPNNLGGVILTPDTPDSDVYHLVHRFSDEASLRAWEDSDTRKALSEEANRFSSSERRLVTGMEAWFDLERSGVPAPKKWKLAALTAVVTYSITSVLIPLEWLVIPHWPFWLGNVATNLVLAGLMTWVVMPSLGRIFSRWFHG